MAEPLVIHALRNKRAELSGAIIQAEKDLARLRADLCGLDATIRLFDPTAKPASIKPRLRRAEATRFRAGEFSRAVLASLRGAGSPLTVREITWRVALATGLGVSTTASMRASNRQCAGRAGLAARGGGVREARQRADDVAGCVGQSSTGAGGPPFIAAALSSAARLLRKIWASDWLGRSSASCATQRPLSGSKTTA
jgi:hypothetical protein